MSFPTMFRAFAVTAGAWIAAASVTAPLGGCGSANETRSSVTLPPANPAAVKEYVRGVRLMSRADAGSQRRARRYFLRAIEVDPNLWEAQYNLGVLHRNQGELDLAAKRFAAARAIYPDAIEPRLALAEVEHSRGERRKAASLLEDVIEKHDDARDARLRLAAIYREDERYEKALEQAREVLIRDPSDVAALLEVGRVYRAREQYDVAQLVFQKAFELTKDDARNTRAQIQNEQGLLELARGDTQAAFQAFDAAAVSDPEFTPARMNKGSVLLSAGDYDGAASEYRAVLQADADELHARVALGAALRGLGKHRQAKREYERVLKAAPNHLAALFNLAVLRAEFLDQRPRALELFRRFVELAPRNHEKRAMAEQYIEEIGSAGGAS